MIKNEKGFGIIEIILVVVVIGLLITVGWLFFDRQNNQNKEHIKTIESTSSVSDGKAVEQSEIEYKEFKNLGIKIKLDDNANKFTYEEKDDIVLVNSNEFKSEVDNICPQSPTSSIAVIARQEGLVDQSQVMVKVIKQFSSFTITDVGSPTGFQCSTEYAANKMSEKTGEFSKKVYSIFENSESI